MSTVIHPTAVVDPGAQLGENVVVGPYAIIEADTRIGDNTHIDAFAQIKRFTTMGSDNHIHSNSLVGGDPQDIKFKGAETTLVMGDRNIIREFTTIHRGTPGGRGETRIGSDCMIMAYAHVAHDCRLSDHSILTNCVMLAGHVDVGYHAVVGGMCGVHQFSRIGDYAFIGGMTGVTMDVPPYCMAAGTRGSLRGLNTIGLRRAGISREAIRGLKEAYMAIFRSELTRQEALSKVEAEESEIPEVRHFLEFIRSSERGCLSDVSRNAKHVD
ncbi:UDP-N-acetylglucosamine acyltransferase [Desulfobaculum xiamenense]|uniref:Acyl-[acyl-carrier-protein]--UDP-N-acetylglucosamine O-acyltransferase n=1 Tax=Desulfobaculum xiamenense TaxID=995050 RepID=A0A846QNW7_9BACT|nr:UDP-N-acetylglucosamine acyltransferase [Desulfobaculum xiamenense]